MNYNATALLLSWKRQDNLKKIIKDIRQQSVPIEIILWNNNINDNTFYDVDLQINSNKNLMCFPRWMMAGYAKTEYVFSLDDDLSFKDKNIIQDCITYANINNCSIGMYGVILNDPKKDYWKSSHVQSNQHTDQTVDILKGRFIFCKRYDLYNLNISSLEKNSDTGRGDDIIVSSVLKKKIIPSFLYDRFINLNDSYALYKQLEHRESRKKTTNQYFKK